ncbi:rod shape-determining protein MreD [bacterium]|nr:MAG: rod shape-determining protein MreD [bacterium]
MIFVYFAILLILSLVLQTTVIPFVFPQWLAAGIDLPLVLAAHIAVTWGKITGMLSGLILGYFQDALSGGILGINGIGKIIVGFTGGVLREKFFVNSLAHRLGSLFGAITAGVLSKLLILHLFSLPAPSPASLMVVWAVIGNTLFALIINSFLERFEMRIGVRVEEELSLGG